MRVQVLLNFFYFFKSSFFNLSKATKLLNHTKTNSQIGQISTHVHTHIHKQKETDSLVDLRPKYCDSPPWRSRRKKLTTQITGNVHSNGIRQSCNLFCISLFGKVDYTANPCCQWSLYFDKVTNHHPSLTLVKASSSHVMPCQGYVNFFAHICLFKPR